MFGVDKHGNDILSPQFSKGQRRSREARPGSSLDMEMREHSYVSSLSKSPKFRRAALDRVLKDLYEKDEIQLDASILKEVRQEMIDNLYDRRLERMNRDREHQARLVASAHSSITGSGLLHHSKLDEEVHAFQNRKYRQKLESEYDLDHPRVLKVALRRAFKDGSFDSHQDFIKSHIEQSIRERAVELAHKDAQEQMVHASRNAIQSINVF